MNTRAATFAAAMIASLFFSANAFAAPEDAAADNTEQPVEHCLTSPRDYTPPGTRWRYRIEPSSGRRCWFLKDDAEKAAGKAAAPSTAAAEEPAPAARRKKQAAPRTLSDARAELSSAPVDQDTRPPAKNPPVPPAPAPPLERKRPPRSHRPRPPGPSSPAPRAERGSASSEHAAGKAASDAARRAADARIGKAAV